MEDELLIECVRNYGCLYDMADPKFLDTQHKTSIWKSIAEQVHQSYDDCRKRWRNIRDQFTKSVNKRKTKSGQSAQFMKRYRYHDNLQFLVPFIQDRETISNIEETEEIPDISTPNVEESMDRPTPISVPLSQPPCDTQTSQLSTTSSSSKKRKRHFSRTMPPEEQQNESASNILMKYIIEKNSVSQNEIHPIDAFFQGLIPTIKGFTPYYQHLAKGKIFAIVQELEYAQMQPSVQTFEVETQGYKASTSSSINRTTTAHPPEIMENETNSFLNLI